MQRDYFEPFQAVLETGPEVFVLDPRGETPADAADGAPQPAAEAAVGTSPEPAGGEPEVPR